MITGIRSGIRLFALLERRLHGIIILSHYKNEQMLECLLVEMRGIWQMVAKMETCLKMMNACLEDMRANQKKLEAKMETSHEKTRGFSAAL
jgi:hypothetical protein